MSKRLFIALSLMAMMAICILPMCKKAPEPINQITFGDYEGMDVVTFDSIEWDYYEEFHLISLSNTIFIEGKSLVFETILDKTAFSYPISDSMNWFSINIYNHDSHDNQGIAFHNQFDHYDLYLHNDTTIVQTDSATLIYTNSIFSCNQLSENDLYSTSPFHLFVQHHENEVLLDDNSLDCIRDCTLYESSVVVLSDTIKTEEGINIYSLVYMDMECFFPLNEPFYFGFKLSDHFYNDERLGWIKLIIEPDANVYYRLRPLEVALQKKE